MHFESRCTWMPSRSRISFTAADTSSSSREMSRDDEDVSAAVKDILEREGIHVHLDSKCITVGKKGDEITATIDCADGPRQVSGSHLLLAAGRRPNTDDLGLDKAGVLQDKHGYIVVDDELRTNVPGIWALAAGNAKAASTHTSYNHYEIVAAHLLE